MPENTLFSCEIGENEDTLFDFKNPRWEGCDRATITRYWNGKSVLKEKGYNWRNLTRIRSLWNDETLFFTLSAGLTPSTPMRSGVEKVRLRACATQMWWWCF